MINVAVLKNNIVTNVIVVADASNLEENYYSLGQDIVPVGSELKETTSADPFNRGKRIGFFYNGVEQMTDSLRHEEVFLREQTIRMQDDYIISSVYNSIIEQVAET